MNTTSNKIGYVEVSGTNTDGSYRLVTRSIFETTDNGIYEVYSAANAYHPEISMSMTRDELNDRYDSVVFN